MKNIKQKLTFLSEQNYPRSPCQQRLAGFTRIINLLGQALLFG